MGGGRIGGRKLLSIRMMLVDRALQPGERPAEQEEQRWTPSAESLLMSPARLQGPGHTSKEEKTISLQL